MLEMLLVHNLEVIEDETHIIKIFFDDHDIYNYKVNLRFIYMTQDLIGVYE